MNQVPNFPPFYPGGQEPWGAKQGCQRRWIRQRFSSAHSSWGNSYWSRHYTRLQLLGGCLQSTCEQQNPIHCRLWHSWDLPGNQKLSVPTTWDSCLCHRPCTILRTSGIWNQRSGLFSPPWSQSKWTSTESLTKSVTEPGMVHLIWDHGGENKSDRY